MNVLLQPFRTHDAARNFRIAGIAYLRVAFEHFFERPLMICCLALFKSLDDTADGYLCLVNSQLVSKHFASFVLKHLLPLHTERLKMNSTIFFVDCPLPSFHVSNGKAKKPRTVTIQSPAFLKPGFMLIQSRLIIFFLFGCSLGADET